MAKIDYGSNQGRSYDEYLPETWGNYRTSEALKMANDPRARFWCDGIAADERVQPLPGRLTFDEWLQRRMPSDNMGFALALAIVSGICIGVLVLHWATKAGLV